MIDADPLSIKGFRNQQTGRQRTGEQQEGDAQHAEEQRFHTEQGRETMAIGQTVRVVQVTFGNPDQTGLERGE